MKKTKILYIIATLDIGGTERQLTELVKRLNKEKYEPIVCCLTRGGPLKKQIDDAGIKVVVLGKKKKLDFGILFKLVKLIKQEKSEIVHTFLWTSNTWGRIAAILAGVPVIISSERSTDLWKGWFEFSIDRMLTLFTRKVIVNSNIVGEFIKAKGIKSSKIEVVYNGVDTEIYDIPYEPIEIKSSLGLDTKKPVVAYIGRLSYEKNPQLFIRVAADIIKKKSDVQFLIVGDGELRDEVELQIKSLGIEKNVKIAGYREDVTKILKAIDMVVLTSLWEGLPNILIEAGASSRPVVSFDMGGVREIVKDNETGFVVPLSDEQKFIEKIISLLDNPGIAQKMGSEGRNFIRGKFEISEMIQKMESIYKNVRDMRNP